MSHFPAPREPPLRTEKSRLEKRRGGKCPSPPSPGYTSGAPQRGEAEEGGEAGHGGSSLSYGSGTEPGYEGKEGRNYLEKLLEAPGTNQPPARCLSDWEAAAAAR